ncbi:MAG TPA: DUF4301 family protein, partial [Thermoanaerobaculia bacterium]|nr:DUF4301 family protein [Thermoanaerobaculia bacterium]
MAQLTDQDLRQLEGHGISEAEAERQLALLASPPQPPKLARPCTAGDGIARLDPARHGGLSARYDEARAAGRAMKLVPASGAASRMFKTLLPWAAYAGQPEVLAKEVSRRAVAGDPAAGDPIRFLSELPRFPFYDELAAAFAGPSEIERHDLEELRRRGEAGAILHALLAPERLGYDARPKALIPFHRYGGSGSGAAGAARSGRGAAGPASAGDGGGEARTAFAEHLVEAAGFLAGGDGRVRLHFTVPPEAREAIEDHLADARERLERRLGVTFEVTFSVQSPATDTLALDPGTGGPFRLANGRLLLRPGGHGALIRNLDAVARAGGDLVFVKNIDNVQPDRVKDEVVRWKKLLGGHLLELRERVAELLGELAAEGGEREAERFLAEHLGFQAPAAWQDLSPEERRRRLAERLDRPLRVAGMVVNRGEPGGGPFWVRSGDGSVSAQIVERSQIDEQVPGQIRVFNASTHFNPVDLACAVRDFRNQPYDLPRYVDESAVFIAEKSHEGRPLLALERPGLWNGAMAGWNTAFVEVPETTFSPVKTVFDLLREEHQA